MWRVGCLGGMQGKTQMGHRRGEMWDLRCRKTKQCLSPGPISQGSGIETTSSNTVLHAGYSGLQHRRLNTFCNKHFRSLSHPYAMIPGLGEKQSPAFR